MDILTIKIISFPPLPEQKRIVAKLDKAFAEIEEKLLHDKKTEILKASVRIDSEETD